MNLVSFNSLDDIIEAYIFIEQYHYFKIETSAHFFCISKAADKIIARARAGRKASTQPICHRVTSTHYRQAIMSDLYSFMDWFSFIDILYHETIFIIL